MSIRRDRGKAAFPPNQNNLGGAMEIIEDYRHYQKRMSAIQPSTTEIAYHKKRNEDIPLSERLRINRAVRRAAVDTTAVEHVNRIYHMHRRIEDQYSNPERDKDPWDTSVHPSFVRRPTNVYQEMIKGEMAAWAKKGSRPIKGDGYVGWSIKESMADAFPTSRYATAHCLADHNVYKQAIMGEIIDNRMYKEADLRRLFRAYIRLSPLGDKDTVEAVVAEIKQELDVN